jgi:hypothetical protein
METSSTVTLIELSDAAVVAAWLNAAKDARAIASYKRVASVHQQLEDLHRLRKRLSECGPDAQQDAAAWRRYKAQQARLKAKLAAKPVRFPAYRNPNLDVKLRRQIAASCSALNQAMEQYAFHPQVVYGRLPGFSVLQNLWAGGMASDSNPQWFEMKIQDWIISEAVAVLALVRLQLSGEVEKVRLCATCKERWLAAGKSNYRFHSAKCREAFYKSQPDYLERKAKNQRNYRKAEKKKLYAFLAEERKQQRAKKKGKL